MWLGLLYLPSSEDGEEVILCAWEGGRERPFTVAGPLHAVTDMARLLREAAAGSGTATLPPRCDACLEPFDLPLL
jgi:hypothetical protein